MATYTLNVNGKTEKVDVADGNMPLLWVLRDKLDLKGTKFGCGVAACGACTVHIDGQVARACVTPVSSVGASSVTTIEAIGATKTGQAVQKAWLDVDVMQCGYCQSRPDDGRHRPDQLQPEAHRQGHRHGDAGQCLPLWHLRAHPRGHQDGRRRRRKADTREV